MRIIAQIALNGLAVWLAAYLVPGISYEGGILYLLLTGLLIGVINLLVKPLVTLLAFPLVVLSLGLFLLVINGAMLFLASLVLSGLHVDGFWAAILGGLVLTLFNWIAGTAGKKKKKKKE